MSILEIRAVKKKRDQFGCHIHCAKSVRIQSYSGPHFSAFGLNAERYPYSIRMRKNADRNNSDTDTFHAVTTTQQTFSC